MSPWLALLLGWLGPDLPASRLAVIRSAPEFTLVNQEGQKVAFSSFRGKMVLVSFVFTTCNGTCPATTHRLATIHHGLEKVAGLKGQVHLVSISLDPARDTPEILRGYMRLYDLPASSWTFLTGTSQEVNPVLASWGMWARPAANGQLDHPSRVFLVDGRGQVREIYNLDFLRLPWVLEDLTLLLKEQGLLRVNP